MSNECERCEGTGEDPNLGTEGSQPCLDCEGSGNELSKPLRVALAQIAVVTAHAKMAERVIESARVYKNVNDDGHLCAKGDLCVGCEFGYELAAYDAATMIDLEAALQPSERR